MILEFFFFFLFPVVLVTLLSLPLFLWLRNRDKQSLVIYIITGLFLSLIVTFMFLASLILMTNTPVDGALLIVLVVTCYGLVLGSTWFLFTRSTSLG